MAKRVRPQAPAGSFPDYDAMNIDELHRERRSIGMQMQAVGRQYSGLRTRTHYLSARIRQLRDGETGIGISDHAVIRYLERVKGIDVRAVRDEIRAMAALKSVDNVRDQVAKEGDLRFAIADGRTVTTMWAGDRLPAPPTLSEPQTDGSAR